MTRALLGLLLAWLAGPALAQPVAAPHIRAQLVAESMTPAPGRPATIAILMTPEPGWHGYWRNPGDAGLAMTVDWMLPAGVKAGSPAYPVPERLTIAGLMNYVYEGEHALLVTLSVPPGMRAGSALPVRVKAHWLACTNEVCVPEQGDLAIDLIVGDGTIDSAARARFDAWRAKLPRPLGGAAAFAVDGRRIRIGIPFPAAAELDKPYFYPATDGVIDYAAAQAVRRDGDTLIVETVGRDGAAAAKRIEGVLRIGDGVGLAVTAAPGAVSAGGAAIGDAAPVSATTVLLALGGALLGGLILNIMPCVFPILSLKALSLAKTGVDERAARAEALAYAGGVMLVCVALGVALLALRASGVAVGWAFQLQDPRVIGVLLLLVTGIALNLAGLFEIGSIDAGGGLAARGGVAGSFWTGALAAFVATPCTGPFMGAALGAALVLPAAAAVAIFAGLGLGLALPFLAIGFVPALRRLLPRPGSWMGIFRRILSLPMFVTALGLAWILGKQAGVDGMTLGLLATLIAAAGLWWAGSRQAAGRAGGWLRAAPLLLVAITLAVLIPRAPAAASETAEATAFSEARLAAVRAAGQPAFVYFTADWCLTCKVNEKAAIERDEVTAAFKAKHVAVLVGDWTNGDPAIGRFLEAHGRSGVPLYLFYRPGKPEPEVLPQVLTPGMLIGLIS